MISKKYKRESSAKNQSTLAFFLRVPKKVSISTKKYQEVTKSTIKVSRSTSKYPKSIKKHQKALKSATKSQKVSMSTLLVKAFRA